MKEKDVLFVYDETGGEQEVPAIREELASYFAEKRQGEFTVDDFDDLPEEMLAELIDGVIYDMNTPTTGHQGMGLEIRDVLSSYVKNKNGKCIALAAPVSVQLDCDNRTMVIPDVLVVCDRKKFMKGIVYGAPDFVVEVLSPSTRKKDMTIKLRKYRNAGVKEYWLIDLHNQQVIVHKFEDGNQTKFYTFEDKVPVGIFDGQCVVDFKEIYDYVGFLYE